MTCSIAIKRSESCALRRKSEGYFLPQRLQFTARQLVGPLGLEKANRAVVSRLSGCGLKLHSIASAISSSCVVKRTESVDEM